MGKVGYISIPIAEDFYINHTESERGHTLVDIGGPGGAPQKDQQQQMQLQLEQEEELQAIREREDQIRQLEVIIYLIFYS